MESHRAEGRALLAWAAEGLKLNRTRGCPRAGEHQGLWFRGKALL